MVVDRKRHMGRGVAPAEDSTWLKTRRASHTVGNNDEWWLRMHPQDSVTLRFSDPAVEDEYRKWRAKITKGKVVRALFGFSALSLVGFAVVVAREPRDPRVGVAAVSFIGSFFLAYLVSFSTILSPLVREPAPRHRRSARPPHEHARVAAFEAYHQPAVTTLALAVAVCLYTLFALEPTRATRDFLLGHSVVVVQSVALIVGGFDLVWYAMFGAFNTAIYIAVSFTLFSRAAIEQRRPNIEVPLMATLIAIVFTLLARVEARTRRHRFLEHMLILENCGQLRRRVKRMRWREKRADDINRQKMIMISYKHEDYAFASRLAEMLESTGYKVWIDKQIRAGDDWRNEIARVIKHSLAVVFVMSPEAVRSRYCREEIFYASNCDKSIFCVVYRDAAAQLTGGLKLILARKQWVFPPKNYDPSSSDTLSIPTLLRALSHSRVRRNSIRHSDRARWRFLQRSMRESDAGAVEGGGSDRGHGGGGRGVRRVSRVLPTSAVLPTSVGSRQQDGKSKPEHPQLTHVPLATQHALTRIRIDAPSSLPTRDRETREARPGAVSSSFLGLPRSDSAIAGSTSKMTSRGSAEAVVAPTPLETTDAIASYQTYTSSSSCLRTGKDETVAMDNYSEDERKSPGLVGKSPVSLTPVATALTSPARASADPNPHATTDRTPTGRKNNIHTSGGSSSSKPSSSKTPPSDVGSSPDQPLKTTTKSTTRFNFSAPGLPAFESVDGTVFLCHARQDRKFATNLTQMLTGRGIRLRWMRSTRGDIDPRDATEIDSCFAVVFIVSRHSARDVSISEVIHYSYEADKPIIAVTVEPARDEARLLKSMPPSLHMMLQSCLDVRWYESEPDLAFTYIQHSLLTAKVCDISQAENVAVPPPASRYAFTWGQRDDTRIFRKLSGDFSASALSAAYPLPSPVLPPQMSQRGSGAVGSAWKAISERFARPGGQDDSAEQNDERLESRDSKSIFSAVQTPERAVRRGDTPTDERMTHTVSWHPRHVAVSPPASPAPHVLRRGRDQTNFPDGFSHSSGGGLSATHSYRNSPIVYETRSASHPPSHRRGPSASSSAGLLRSTSNLPRSEARRASRDDGKGENNVAPPPPPTNATRLARKPPVHPSPPLFSAPTSHQKRPHNALIRLRIIGGSRGTGVTPPPTRGAEASSDGRASPALRSTLSKDSKDSAKSVRTVKSPPLPSVPPLRRYETDTEGSGRNILTRESSAALLPAPTTPLAHGDDTVSRVLFARALSRDTGGTQASSRRSNESLC